MRDDLNGAKDVLIYGELACYEYARKNGQKPNVEVGVNGTVGKYALAKDSANRVEQPIATLGFSLTIILTKSGSGPNRTTNSK